MSDERALKERVMTLDHLGQTWVLAEDYRELEAENKALREGRGVKVKPLEWKPSTFGFEVQSIIGKYEVYASIMSEHWLWRGENGILFDQYEGKEPGPDEAKDAAQADYERRILSALSLAPVSVGEEEIERAAIAMWHEEARRAGTPGLAKGRTPEAWLEQSDDTRARWIGLARAALRALSEGDQT